MQSDQLRHLLDNPEGNDPWFVRLGLADPLTARANLLHLAEAGLPLDLLAVLCEQFAQTANQLADPDMALNCLERFLLAARSPLSLVALMERDETALPQLLLLFNTSQTLSDLLCVDPEAYDLLRTTEGHPVARDRLVEELVTEIRSLQDDDMVLAALRRFKQRETLRIAFGDIVREMPIQHVTQQISYVADAMVEGALDFAHRLVSKKGDRGRSSPLRRPPYVVLALGKLGGLELNYSSDIDLVLLYRIPTNARPHTEVEYQEYANRVSRALTRLLTESTDMGFAYRVDLRLRPEGRQGQICSRVENALAYYDVRGRTWERQAYVKARAIAGDLALGREYLASLEPWIYRRYLSLADISGIKALKRGIDAQPAEQGRNNVKTGRGGIRDIEFVIQFLQLVNGGALPDIRLGNTQEAIAALEQNGCLTRQERSILGENYRYLRKLEHRLQIMFDLQTHQLPSSEVEQAKLARRMGYMNAPQRTALTTFHNDYRQRTELNRKILDHLLVEAFGDDPENEPEVDLVNDPDPPRPFIESVLGKYPFADVQAAYTHLMSLAEEKIGFLSSRRCRLFLASIAPRLLAAIAKTPDPDATLVTLCRVSDSLGGKATLWELFHTNRPTLNLYVTLCAACPYLVGILTSNPGMIDELVDSLLVDSLPTLKGLERSLTDLTRGAEDIEPILHSFKHAQHVRVGVRDILGKDVIRDTHAALSDIAEVCLKEIVRTERKKLEQKMGRPVIGPPPAPNPKGADRSGGASNSARFPDSWLPDPKRVGQPCELVVLALGKLGGREPNYHSDLDLVFLYEAEGNTVASRRGRNRLTTNNHFFSELGQRIIKQANRVGPHGRLYEVDPRLRPTGRSGSLALPVSGLVRYFRQGEGQLWERQALCKARILVGSPEAGQRTMAAVIESAYGPDWQPADAQSIHDMRIKLQQTASLRNLKRGPGGTMDTEFIVQMLQLKHGRQLPQVCPPGTLDALEALEKAQVLDGEDAHFLRTSYRFQRSVEARVRLMNSAGRHEFPDHPMELAKLAFLLGYSEPDDLANEVARTFRETRARFERILHSNAESVIA